MVERRGRCIVWTATADARSPAAAPPIPSATMTKCVPAYPESSFFLRVRPMSETAPDRRESVIGYFFSSAIVLPSRTWTPIATTIGAVMRWLPM